MQTCTNLGNVVMPEIGSSGIITLSQSIRNFVFIFVCGAYYNSGVAGYSNILLPVALARSIYSADAGVSATYDNGYLQVIFKSDTTITVIPKKAKYGNYVVAIGIK